jgi:hypothetical protein
VIRIAEAATGGTWPGIRREFRRIQLGTSRVPMEPSNAFVTIRRRERQP